MHFGYGFPQDANDLRCPMGSAAHMQFRNERAASFERAGRPIAGSKGREFHRLAGGRIGHECRGAQDRSRPRARADAPGPDRYDRSISSTVTLSGVVRYDTRTPAFGPPRLLT